MNNTLSYFVMLDGQQAGPYTLEQLRSLWKAGRANLATLFWSDDGCPEWRPLSEIVEVIEPPVRYMPPAKELSRCTRGMFVVLGIFFGALGIHNFYAGYIGRGISQLLITVLVGWLVVPLAAVMIWVVVELFGVTTDSKGRKFD